MNIDFYQLPIDFTVLSITTMASSQRTFQTLKGKVAIVTGASRGLGAGFAMELARRGARVSLAKYSDEEGNRVLNRS